MSRFAMFRASSTLASLAGAMGVRAAQLSNKKALLTYCTLTVLGALIFLVVKYFEYSSKYHHGFMPGKFFTDPHGDLTHVEFPNMFFSIYFTMTGIHGLHVVIKYRADDAVFEAADLNDLVVKEIFRAAQTL